VLANGANPGGVTTLDSTSPVAVPYHVTVLPLTMGNGAGSASDGKQHPFGHEYDVDMNTTAAPETGGDGGAGS
jgi:hypothetical protein